MRLRSRSLRRYEGALGRPSGAAARPSARREGLLLTLVDDEGHAGQGEASPLAGHSPETLAAVTQALVDVIPRLGEASGDVAETLRRFPTLDALPSARCAVEVALLDLWGQRRGVSVAAVLGCDAEAVACNAQPGALGDEDIEARCAEAVARGFEVLKLKTGGADFTQERKVLARLRERFAGVTWRLDANGSWTLDEARRRLDALAGLGVAYVEQPCAGAEVFALGERAVPWAADEALIDAEHRARFLADADARRGCAAVVLKPMALGWLAARETALAAGALGLGVVVTHLLDGPVALAAACELARSLPGAWACGLDRHPGLDAWPGVPVPQAQGPWVRRATGAAAGSGAP
ncbi:MAG: mandelate racemase/muconate lactonizing enzyme family protein [Myxococcales bacterium]|nr:mandelate racemase/muconate lactonizing enzyme family protein [Myxococcales bacterium]